MPEKEDDFLNQFLSDDDDETAYLLRRNEIKITRKKLPRAPNQESESEPGNSLCTEESDFIELALNFSSDPAFDINDGVDELYKKALNVAPQHFDIPNIDESETDVIEEMLRNNTVSYMDIDIVGIQDLDDTDEQRLLRVKKAYIDEIYRTGKKPSLVLMMIDIVKIYSQVTKEIEKIKKEQNIVTELPHDDNDEELA